MPFSKQFQISGENQSNPKAVWTLFVYIAIVDDITEYTHT